MVAAESSARVAAQVDRRWRRIAAEPFDVAIEVMLVEDVVQSRAERMGGRARQVFARHPYRGLLRVPPSFAIAIGESVVRGIDRVDR